ncbi:DUF4012 domain-containing protein [Agromyces sp. MMS24-JH15]|uniref:DUF4012 domain-containing protein n=1 Tax=Agromyces sp. MMS24-JH15 TaxID=3243765 RepID=UPI0037482C8F
MLLVLLAATWVVVRGLLAKGELEAAAAAGEEVKSALTVGQVGEAADAAERLVGHAHTAASLTSDPVWRGAEAVPVVGDDLAAVRVIAGALDHVATDAVDPLIAIADDIDPNALRRADGSVDTEALAAASPALHQAALAVGRASEEVDAVDPEGLFGPVEEARAKFSEVLAEASTIASGIDSAVSLMPAALGADGPRDYLLLALNNAELRSAGGIPGAFAVIHVDDGALRLGRQAATDEFPWKPTESLEVPEGTFAVWGDQPGRFIQDVTMTPDFAQTGELTAAMWQRQFGEPVDGVIAIDPVALSYVLDAIGPIMIDGAPLEGSDAVMALLVAPYRNGTDQDQRDDWFRDVAAEVFSSVADGEGNAGRLLDAVMRGAEQQRVAIWSADPDEQAAVEASSFAGQRAAQFAAGPEAYAVYFNDSTGGKMGPYLDVAFGVGAAVERPDGLADVTVQVTMSNRVTEGDLSVLAPDALGLWQEDHAAGEIMTILTVYAPPGAWEGGVYVDGKQVSQTSRKDGDQAVVQAEVRLTPGQAQTIEFRFLSAEPGQVDPVLLHTPLVFDAPIDEL